jgi:hypothetical protein
MKEDLRQKEKELYNCHCPLCNKIIPLCTCSTKPYEKFLKSMCERYQIRIAELEEEIQRLIESLVYF